MESKKQDDPMEKRRWLQGLMIAGSVTSKRSKNRSQSCKTREKDISYCKKNPTADQKS